MLAQALLFSLLSAAPDPQALRTLQQEVALEAGRPLEVKELARVQRDGATVVTITYAGRDGAVPALLVLPAARPERAPAVLFLHRGRGDKAEFLEDALLLARAGGVSLLIDAPFVRPDRAATSQAALFRQTVVDLRRGVELLAARPEVDPERLAYVGHALGASLGGALLGTEPRLRAAVLMAGLGDFSGGLREGQQPHQQQWRKETPAGKREAELAALAPYDGVVGIAAAKATVFHQFARHDALVSHAEAMTYLGATPDPKLFKFYAGSGLLDGAARRDRLQWLGTVLGFSVPAGFEPPMVSALPAWSGVPPFEPGKLRPVYAVPGMMEVEVHKDIVYRGEGAQALKLDVYLPPAASRRPLPAVVMVHGSLHPAILRRLKDTPSFEYEARWIAATGLIVVVPHVGSPASGPTPAEWYTDLASVQDNVRAAIAYVRREAPALRINPERLAILTFSAGGLTALPVALADPQPWLRCIAALYPLVAVPPLTGKKLLAGVTAQRTPPLFVIRSEHDFPDLLRELDAFLAEAKRRKLDLTFRALQDGHHAFEFVDDNEDSRALLEELGGFLHRHLD